MNTNKLLLALIVTFSITQILTQSTIKFSLSNIEQLSLIRNNNGDLLFNLTDHGTHNSLIGTGSGLFNTGIGNSFFGSYSGFLNTSGNSNTHFGAFSGNQNQTGSNNVAIGNSSLYSSINISGLVAVGDSSMYHNGDGATLPFQGSLNTAVGFKSLFSNSTGYANTSVGYNSGLNNTTGRANAFFGDRSGQENTTGFQNCFFGSEAGISNATGTMNSFVGNQSGYFNTTGKENSYFGNASGATASSAKFNSFFGSYSGFNNLSGDHNVFFGRESGFANMAGQSNTYVGTQSGRMATGSRNIFIGFGAGYNETGNDKLHINNSSATTSLIYGEFDNGLVRINGQDNDGTKAALEIISGSQTMLIDGNEIDVKGNNNLSFNGNSTGQVRIGVNGNSTTSHTVFGKELILSNPSEPILRFDRSGVGYDQEIYVTSNGDMRFRGGNNNSGSALNDLFTISGSGEVGVGTITPEKLMHISSVGEAALIIDSDINDSGEEGPSIELRGKNGNNKTIIGIDTGSDVFNIRNPNLGPSEGGLFLIDEFGHMGINSLQVGSALNVQRSDELFALTATGNIALSGGTVSLTGLYEPSYKLTLPNSTSSVTGQAIANAWNTYSDGRVKKNRKVINYGLAEILALNPVTYDHYSSRFEGDQLILSEACRDIGFIAQEVYQLIEEVVIKPKDENNTLWAINYEKLSPIIVKAIQEQQIIIQEQNSKILLLENKLSDLLYLETRMAKIESKINQ